MSIKDYSTSASLNTNIGGIYIGPNPNRADMDNAFRQLMADIAALASTSGTESIGYKADFSGSQDSSVSDKLNERVSLLDAIPTAIRATVVAGTNTTDLAPYINQALAAGGVIDTLNHTYLIKSRIIPAANTHLVGNGTFLAHASFTDAAYGDGLHMMLNIVSGLKIDAGITFNGNSIGTAGFWLYGARNTAAVSNVTIDCAFKNLSFTGIDISRNGGAWANANIKVRASVENVGWGGVNLEGITDLNHDNLRVTRTGWTAIHVSHCFNVFGRGFYANKATAPYRVYDGTGGFAGVEKGFLFSHFSVNIAQWTEFLLYDNRNAGYDGFGIGEDGPLADPESANIYAQGQIWYPGLFGFDVSSDMIAEVQVFYPENQGVQLGFDLGGTLANVNIRAQVYNNLNDEGARFSATGAAVRTCSFSSGSSALTITAGTGFFVVPGQKVTGTNIPSPAYVGTVVGDVVTLVTTQGGSTPAVTTGAGPQSVTFRGVINFVNCALDIQTANCIYGVGIESGSDGYATYSNCRVTGDLSGVTTDSVRFLNGVYPSGMAVDATKYNASERAKSGTSFSAVGNNTFLHAGGVTLNEITNGYDGQDITVFANTDLTLNFDWLDVGGFGVNKLIGNANSDVLLKAGGMFRAKYRPSVGWYVYAIAQSN